MIKMKSGMDIGERMKSYYEHRYKIKLPMRLPIIIRIDGKTFHTWTRKHDIKKPFDHDLINAFNTAAIHTCYMIQGVQMAYLQSDEVSFLIHSYKSIDQQSWFDNNLQKLVSVSSSIFTSCFNYLYEAKDFYDLAIFDSRAFVLPEEEVCNYFIWRQQDWSRNSLQMLARQVFSHNELNGKNSSDMHEMLHEKGWNWDSLSTKLKNGRCIVRENILDRNIWIVDDEIPMFTQNRNYIEKYLEKEE